ncbi:MAG: Ig-like domain-containing protein [Anaerolineae bacterium]
MRRHIRLSLLLLVILGLAISSANVRVRGQDDQGTLTPGILSSFPAQREVIGPDATIQITFNQPMDKQSIESALLIDPRVEGTLSWKDDSTLIFDPAGPLTRGGEYLISVAPEAKTASGVELGERFNLDFSIAPNLSVQQVIPAPDATEIDARAAVTVIFDRPVVPVVTTGDQSNLPQPLTFEPAIEGTGEWVGTAIYTFRPNTAWAGSTTYTATVRSDLTDVDGSPMTGAYSWKFSTGAPRLLYTYPSADQSLVELESVIQITFNQPMDVDSTRAAFTVRNTQNGADVAGSIIFSDDKTTLTFTPASKLALATTYQVEITGAAKSATGEAVLVNPQAYVFSTPPFPAVVSTNPTNGALVQPGAGVMIQYNTNMDASSFAGKVHITPEPKTFQIYGGQYTQINFLSQPATTYTITIDAGVKDIYGNVIDQPFVSTFTTTDAPPEVALGARDVVNVTSAYRPETVVQAAAINVSQVIMNVTALEFNELLSLPWSSGYLDLYNYNPPRVTRTVQFPLNVDRNVRVDMTIPLSGEAGVPVPPGAYYLDIGAPEVVLRTGGRTNRMLWLVTTANLTVKVAPGQVLVWATDLKSGQPLINVEVQLFDEYGRVKIGSAQTDTDGIARFNISTQNEILYAAYMAAINTGEAFALTSTRWTNELEPYQSNVSLDVPMREKVYLYTDQPIYRPGRPVYFRGLARIQDDVTFKQPPYSDLRAIITDPNGQEVYNKVLTLNNFGGFSDHFDLPQDAMLGQYYLRVDHTTTEPNLPFENTLYFQVAEFRPPEFLTTTTADKTEYAAGDTIKVSIDGKFLFGGAVSGGQVSWTAIANQGYFNYTGPGNYDFGQFGWYYWDWGGGGYAYNRQVATGTGVLDANGQLQIEVPADLGDNATTQDFTIEATVTDVSNQSISGRTTVTVHPADFYIGLAPKVYVGKAGEPLDTNLITVNWNSSAKPDQLLHLKATQRNWKQNPDTLEWALDANIVAEQDITTGADGKGMFTFTPEAGIYEIEATGRDSRERLARTTTTVWVQGSNSVSWSRDDKRLTLIADAKSYKPGDTAGVLITSPFPEEVTALVTVERAGVMKSEVVKFTGSYTYRLPLEELHAPNVYVAVALFRSSGDEGRVNELRYGLINLPVEVQKRLKVQLTPSTTQAEPGATVRFDVLITDLEGNPVSAEVGLALSDVATLSVGAPNSQAIFDYFWSPRPLSVNTSAAMYRVVDAIKASQLYLNQFDTARQEAAFAGGAPQPTMSAVSDGIAAPAANEAAADSDKSLPDSGGAGGDQAQQQITPRTNFVDTPLWLPSLITDAEGKATAEVTLPDNLTTWRLDARATSAETAVGDATIEIISTKPLLVRPATPRFFVVGDRSELAMVVNNNTDLDLDVTVKLEAKGVTLRADATDRSRSRRRGAPAWRGWQRLAMCQRWM